MGDGADCPLWVGCCRGLNLTGVGSGPVSTTRRLAAIMFTDMVGSTALAQENEVEALGLREEQEAIVRPLFVAHQGQVVKSLGDGFLVKFDSALRATECAIEVQQRLHERNKGTGVLPLSLRIGVHLGDVEVREADIFGDSVNVASRIEPLAEPGGVCLSYPVFDQVRNKVPHQFEKLGPKRLKGVREPVEVYRIVFPWSPAEVAAKQPLLPRLAVLPLANLSPDPGDEYFADGTTEELISVLSGFPGLRVIAHSSVGRYRSSGKSIPAIANELDVAHLLQGSVRRSERRIRITMQLIDAKTQEHVWAESYDRELGDIFAIQADVAERTAVALRIRLLNATDAAARQRPTVDLEAYELFLRGIHALQSVQDDPSGGQFSRAIDCLEEAIRKDPNFALAHAYLANLLIGESGTVVPTRVALERARDLVARAMRLDPRLSETHAARANLAMQAEMDWPLAESEFRRAIEINPSNSLAHLWYGNLLKILQRFEEAKSELETATSLDPLGDYASAWRGHLLSLLGEYEAACAQANRTLELYPGQRWPHVLLAWYHFREGRREDARQEIAVANGPLSPWLRIHRAILRARLGEPDEARQILTELEAPAGSTYVAPDHLAALLVALGRNDDALVLLEKDCREGERGLSFDYQLDFFDPIRADPRFAALLRSMNLPTSVKWRTSGAA